MRGVCGVFSMIKLNRLLLCAVAWVAWCGGCHSQPETFTVCVWNVQNFGVTDRFVDNRPVPEAMKPDGEIRAMEMALQRIHPDILGILEVIQHPDDLYLKKLRQVLDKAGLQYPFVSTTKNGEDSRIQNVLFSKFPIVKDEPLTKETFRALQKSKSTKESVEISLRVSRGIVNTVVQVAPHCQVRLMLLHLKSRRLAPDIGAEDSNEPGDAYIRRNEALIVKNAMNRYLDENPKQNLLVMGDFNDVIRSKAVQTLIGRKDASVRIFDLWLKDWSGEWWTHFYSPDKSYERIDYMLVSQPLFHQWVSEKSYIFRKDQNDPPDLDVNAASDHRPLVATFRIAHE